MTDFAIARHNMVESQIRTNKVTDERLLAAMSELPRDLFLPKPQRGIAYVDEDIPIGNGRYVMEPMVLARLLQAAAVAEGDLVLDVGCNTGYSAAVLSRLAGTVVALESDPLLAAEATRVLAELGADNVAVIEGALPDGYAKQAPYDMILLSGSVADIPGSLEDQLAEGGRLVAVLSTGQGIGRAALFTRMGGVLSHRVIFDAGTPVLPGFEREDRFEF